ncbi:nickel transporter [Streptomyces sp. NBC_01725]|uniref:nickel transporter n=1 Tax=Streptomyces sp. NBC_01725 TaxID=2975923 RepID=UPI002E2E5404|nr:nickel transporter [Streptomyces sp. NBC_01725]
MRHVRRTAATVSASIALALAAATPAQAHPLGNFSVNHHDGLRLAADRIQDTAVVDSAEIPTAQDRGATDTDRDGTVSAGEAAHRAAERCTELAGRTGATVNGRALRWHTRKATLTYAAGAAGLPVARLTCALTAEADLTGPAEVGFVSGADTARTGWKEITAVAGAGVRLARSSVPATSPSGVLRRYPANGGEQPPAVTAATLRTQPGDAGYGGPAGARDTRAVAKEAVLFPALENRLTDLTAGRDLTWPVGLFAVLLSLLLGAGHAALPGHAKLAVAACLARGKGGARAAVAVGATVTATHTAGVLVTGLLLTAGGGLLGERLLGLLGAVSGAVIAGLGAMLTVTAVRGLRAGATPGHGHNHTHGDGHSHGQGHTHGDHRHGKAGRTGLPALLGVGLAGGLVPSPSALVVLLGAIALSRTYFGVLLVIGYGLGMALTLTSAGLLLAGGGSRLATLGERRLPALRRYTPYGAVLTAFAVLAVGIGLTVRSLV